MKRRGFLGMLGAGAVAGPAMAKQAAVSINATPITGGASALGMEIDGMEIESGHWVKTQGNWDEVEKSNYLVQRANELRRLISGEQEDPSERDLAFQMRRQQVEPAICCLRSISHTHKVRMVMRANRQIEREVQKSSWMEELLGLETIK